MTEHTEGTEQPTTQYTEGMEQPTTQTADVSGSTAAQQNPGRAAIHYVYAIGTVDFRFPTLALEKEFAQATGRGEETTGLTDRAAIHSVLSDPANRYLVRQLCFVMTIQGLETYILYPRDPADLDLLVEAVRTAPRPGTDVDVVFGMRGPIAPPEVCNGLMVPIVVVDQLYSFDLDSLIEGVPLPGSIPEDQHDQFRSTIEELFRRTMQLTDNAGATDEHRALNYLAVRYPAIYERTAQAYHDNYSLTEVAVRPSRLSGVRKIVDVIFSYTHRQTDVTEKYFVRVDVTEEFPFLVTKLSPYYDR